MEQQLDRLLEAWVASDSSDLHIKAPNPPFYRLHGSLIPLPGYAPLSELDVRHFAKTLLGEKVYDQFKASHELDTAKTLENGRRIRINAHVQSGGVGLALRLLPATFFPLESLGLPLSVCRNICGLHHGLVLVTGATGSGKSTTLASLINELNQTRDGHVITVEDPIEYRHTTNKCLITQREVGDDTASFAEALKRILREDPDIVMIGEMRDCETMRAALTLAETGHLTFSTLHTGTAIHTMTRIIGSFPANEQEQIRTQLAGVLRYVICQQLIPLRDGGGRCLAAEVLVGTSAVLSLIRENRIHQIASTMQTGTHIGMTTMNQSLKNLVADGRIDRAAALALSPDPTEF
jgi:twitching motility protein PilT